MRLDHEAMGQKHRNISERKVNRFLSPGKPGHQATQPTRDQKQNQLEGSSTYAWCRKGKVRVSGVGTSGLTKEAIPTTVRVNTARIPPNNHRGLCLQGPCNHWKPHAIE